MAEELTFADRLAFRQWLTESADDSDGVWLLFGKKGGPKTLSATEALEEALCFGWIDGVMESLGDTSYRKYFARRTPKSKWSEKNKRLVQTLIEKGVMDERGLKAVKQAQQNGQWDTNNTVVISEAQIAEFIRLVQPYEPAYTNLLAMSPSVRRNYTGLYLDAKSEKTRQTRLEKIIDRLNQNLKPM